jgi:hypothetical protein
MIDCDWLRYINLEKVTGQYDGTPQLNNSEFNFRKGFLGMYSILIKSYIRHSI